MGGKQGRGGKTDNMMRRNKRRGAGDRLGNKGRKGKGVCRGWGLFTGGGGGGGGAWLHVHAEMIFVSAARARCAEQIGEYMR